jgi:hypothetical protein
MPFPTRSGDRWVVYNHEFCWQIADEAGDRHPGLGAEQDLEDLGRYTRVLPSRASTSQYIQVTNLSYPQTVSPL